VIDRLHLVRHGESAANVAAAAAERSGAEALDVPWRDADVPLSATGEEQARALGTWWRATVDDPDRTVVLSSPYLRARRTVELALTEAGDAERVVVVDERFRDRELGILDLLTRHGVQVRHPDEEARRQRLGKWYHRPPGGESWVDLALRLRSGLRDLVELDGVDRAVVACHDAVVSVSVGVLLGLQEREVLDLAQRHPVTNASVTTLERHGDGWRLAAVGDVAHLEREDAPVTSHRGAPDARTR